MTYHCIFVGHRTLRVLPGQKWDSMVEQIVIHDLIISVASRVSVEYHRFGIVPLSSTVII